MGYTTDFIGQFNLDKPLTPEQSIYLIKFNKTRRMKRDSKKAMVLNDPYRTEVDLTIGEEGQYFVGGLGDFGQGHDPSITDYNSPPIGQPGLWCQWTVGNKYGEPLSEHHDFNSQDTLPTSIVWDYGEKFYEYKKWLSYIIENFLKPWGRTLNGEIVYQGEDIHDRGKIVVIDNIVSMHDTTYIAPIEDEN